MKMLLVFLLLAFFSGCNRGNTTSDERPVEQPHPISLWVYGAIKDKMDGSITRYAVIFSINNLPGKMSYEKTPIDLTIYYPSDVIFAAHGAQFNCTGGYIDDSDNIADDLNTCSVRVRFDDSKPVSFGVKEFGDSNSYLSIVKGKLFISKLKSSKKVLVEFPVFQMGLPVMTFNVHGFNAKQLQSAKP